MNRISISFILILLYAVSCKTSKPASDEKTQVSSEPSPVGETTSPAFNYHEASTWLLGYFKVNKLKQEPHSVWYFKGFDEYQCNSDALNRLKALNTDSLTIRIVMGTWCPDSRREVPRFMRILDLWNFPESKVSFIGVDEEKRSPVGEYESLNIERVPTFIIYKNNIEAGRIIENPVTSLEQDMVNILTGMSKNDK